MLVAPDCVLKSDSAVLGPGTSKKAWEAEKYGEDSFRVLFTLAWIVIDPVIPLELDANDLEGWVTSVNCSNLSGVSGIKDIYDFTPLLGRLR